MNNNRTVVNKQRKQEQQEPFLGQPSIPVSSVTLSNTDQQQRQQLHQLPQQEQAPLDPREAAGTYRPEQSAGWCLFTTTDESGYPDRQDGLSAYSPPGQGQDPHGYHKHQQVPPPFCSVDENELVDRRTIEVAGRLGGWRGVSGVGETCLPDQAAVAHFLR